MFGYRRKPRTTWRSTPHRIRLELETLEGRCVPATLTYSSYFGGNISDHINCVTTDAAGNIFVGGVVGDDTFPGPGSSSAPPITATGINGFVAELNPTGSQVIFTSLIKTDFNGVTGIAVDGSDNVYATGATEQTSGFATPGAAQFAYGGLGDAFAIKIDGTTHAVDYATYIGGSFVDAGYAIAVNKAGDAIVTGDTESGNLTVKNPLTGQGALQSHAGTDAFVTELNPTGSAFLFSTFLGGNTTDPLAGAGNSDSHARAIALDNLGNIYVTGYTEAADFPVTVGAYQTVSGDAQSVFVTELQAPDAITGSQVLYSTFLSSPAGTPLANTGDDVGNGIAVDRSGNILVTGSTSSVAFPAKNAFQRQLDRGSPALDDAFVSKLNPHNASAAQLVYSTFDGGSAIENGNAIAVDAAGNAFVAGFSNSDTLLGKWPVVNPFQSKQYPGSAFVAEFTSAGGVVFNSKYGTGGTAYGITVSPFGNVIVAGNSESATLNTTANAFQRSFPGESNNGFIAMLTGASVPKTFKGVDADGDQYTVSLSGPGGINVIQDDPGGTGTGPIQTIYLQGTNANSYLTVTVTKKVGDGRVAIGRIVGTGLAQISAPNSDLTGTGINLSGALGSLTLHDVTSGAGILAADLPTQSTTIHAHVIDDGTTIQVGGILNLQAARVGVDTITSPKLTTLNVTGDSSLSISGDFSANLTLTGTGIALGTATIAGNITGSSIHVPAGSIGTVSAGGQITGADIEVPTGGVASLKAGAALNGTTLNLAGTLGTLRAASMDTDTITAARITTLNVPGNTSLSISGNLTAHFTLTGTGTALGTVTVAGQVSGTTIQVENGSVTAFTAAAFTDSTLFLGQGTFAFGGAGGTLTLNQSIGSFRITGTTAAFANSNVAAYSVGTVNLASVQPTNGGTVFGIEAHTKSIGSVHVVSPSFTYSRTGPAIQRIPGGDFEVYQL